MLFLKSVPAWSFGHWSPKALAKWSSTEAGVIITSSLSSSPGEIEPSEVCRMLTGSKGGTFGFWAVLSGGGMFLSLVGEPVNEGFGKG